MAVLARISGIRFGVGVFVLVVTVVGTARAHADVVLDWNAIAVRTVVTQNPFAQARFMAIVQLAVFEAVNAIDGGYQPYLGNISADANADADAAAITAAYRVLATYFPGSADALEADRIAALNAIPDGPAKTAGMAIGEAAAAAMIGARAKDGSSLPTFYWPTSADPGTWQVTVPCPAGGGAFFHWKDVTPFGIPRAADFMPPPPPELTSNRYAKDYDEVKRVGAVDSVDRPQDRADVALFYASASPSQLLNQAARQAATARGDSRAENARALALLNMSISDSLVVSFAAKYSYLLWRPVTAIVRGDEDGNRKTDPNVAFVPFVSTPCFPSYPSNHASGTNGGLEVLRRLYGAAGHAFELTNTNLNVTRYYTSLKQISDNVDDARVYGGIHFRFDQEAGHHVGRNVATYIVKNHLRPVH